MTKKNTKRALYASVISMLLCVTMLIGSTFAWFTDTASTAVNSIQSGNLNVGLVDEYGSSLEGLNLTFRTADGREAANILWEPGCTYELQPIHVINNGTLALKFDIVITGIQGNAKLNEAIEWDITLPDGGKLLPGVTSAPIKISGHMKEDAGNEYQGLTIDGISITVLATQVPHENDSIGPNYDANATYADKWDGTVDAAGLAANTDEATKTVSIYTAAQLAAFAEAVNAGNKYAGYTVNQLAPIDLDNIDWAPIGATNGETINSYPSYTFSGTYNGNGLTISNLKVESAGTHAVAGLFGSANRATIKNVVIDGANIKSEHYAAGILAYETEYTNVIGCTVKNATIISSTNGTGDNGDKAGGIVGAMTGANADYSVSSNTVENCTIIAYRDFGGIIGTAADGLRVEDNIVVGTTIVQDASDDYKDPTPTTAGEIVGRGNPALKNNQFATTKVILAGNGNVVIAGNDVNASNILSAELGNSYANLSGNTMVMDKTVTVKNGELVMEDGTVANNGSDKYVDIRPDAGQKVTISYKDVDFVSTYKNKTYGPATNRFTNMLKFVPKDGEADLVFENCTFDNAKIEINGLTDYAGKVTVSFINCSFSGLGTGPIIDIKNYLDVTVNIEGCSFDVAATGYVEIVSGMASSDITVNANNNTVHGTAAEATTDDALVGTVDQIKINNPSLRFFGSNLDTVVAENNICTGIATEK